MQQILIAQVTGAHGIDGAVRLRVYSDDPSGLKRFRRMITSGGQALTLQSMTAGPRGVTARFAEVANRTQAEALRGVDLFIARADLGTSSAADGYYHADLIGLAVECPEGRGVGTVAAVENFGAGDLLDLALADGRTVLVPFRDEAVPVVDLEAGRLVVHPDFLA